jgi:putative transposase
VVFQSGQYYHIYNRGVNRQLIFFCEDNWGFFLRRLRQHLKHELVDVVAYCLMPTHYHLLIFLKADHPLSKLMQPFGVSYSKAVNRQQARTGPLFQGPFRAKLIDKDEYLLHLSRYLHLNPVSGGMVQHPEDWSFSSYRDFIGLRNGTLPVPDAKLRHFASREAYKRFVEAHQDNTDIQHLLFED